MKSPLTENEQLFLQIKELTTSLNHVNAYVFTKDKQLRYTELLSNVVYGVLKRQPVFDRQFV